MICRDLHATAGVQARVVLRRCSAPFVTHCLRRMPLSAATMASPMTLAVFSQSPNSARAHSAVVAQIQHEKEAMIFYVYDTHNNHADLMMSSLYDLACDLLVTSVSSAAHPHIRAHCRAGDWGAQLQNHACRTIHACLSFRLVGFGLPQGKEIQ